MAALRLSGPVILACALAGAPVALAANGDNSPAQPVPRTRAGVALWPPSGLRPGRPGTRLPRERDSTDYLSTTIPGTVSGHELFQSLDIANGTLYVAYNAGLQIWNISGANAEAPLRMGVKDGWRGDFTEFPPPGEASNFVEDVAALAVGPDEVLIALSGLGQVGTTLWRHARSGFTQIAQHRERVSRQVRMAYAGERAVAFGAGPTAGVVVFDAATGADLGVLGGDASSKRYLDVLEHDGRVIVVASNGNSIPLRLWTLTDPARPESARLRYDGASLGAGVKGVALFEHAGRAYLALVKSHVVRVHAIDHCIDRGCGDVGTPVWQLALPGRWPATEFLTASRGPGGRPYLYYGMETSGLDGTRKELLLDLSGLGDPGHVPEITDGGGRYTDACGNQVDYWGEYYDGNENGFRNFHPRVGRWHGRVFYRATNATLDTHVLP